MSMKNMLKLSINSEMMRGVRVIGRWFSNSVVNNKTKMDPKQAAALNEQCFVVDEHDKITGTLSKKHCHLVSPDGTIPLHRAFSVFLFNKAGDLLLQKRATEKVTYPNYYTNTCCSHPIADVGGEDEEADAIGIRRAAQRRLNYELGIPLEQIPLDKFNYITRIHYKDNGNGIWGEHEIDYVLFLQTEVTVKPNSNEISEISYVPRDELDNYLPSLSGPLTPWFDLILKNRLRLWWDNLENLEKCKDHKNILQLK
ncbi:PREDICTED: isopentenyl-diphosphate Delta-isomerase 1 [Nicrophorus vespilloides]|uniref:isopentenyl-diphosphate Delta-isomerase n=1 Tax=Nicrophorus vespilloides TaxID=110193 RepID=A0ABM1M3N6_NICVS|nr:PREDICTED: isopentenyl-diphosphate Delta-isomerase 1 [Nicrophorus vespilloides]